MTVNILQLPARSTGSISLSHGVEVLYCRALRLCFVSFIVMAAMAGANMGRQEPCFLPYPNAEAVTSLTESQNNFTRDLYTQLVRGNAGNLFFSPFSVMAALGMTYAGAGSATEEQMRSVLHFTQDKVELHKAFQDIVSDLKTESSDYELRTSNMAYISDKLTVLNEYNKTITEKFLSTSKTVNFGAGEEVRQEINAAVEKETNSRIKDLIPSGVLNSLTRMVLVNAVYFKGLWENQFDEKNTYEQDFWISESESIKAPMMHAKKHFRMFHPKDLGAMVLGMDYKGSRLSMLFVLPDEKQGLAQVEAKIAKMDLRDLDKRLHKVEVEVTLPKFKLEESLSLVDHLKDMGIKDLFDENISDLSGISGNRDLYVSHVIHKAFLEVNEKGSEAAAATGVVVQTRMLIRPIPPFVADHPFLFFIRDRRSGFLHFAGRLVNPSAV